MVSLRCQRADRLYVAAQFVGNDNPQLTKLVDQAPEDPLCRLCVSPSLYEDIQHIIVCIDVPPQPMLLAADRDADFVQMPLVVRSWTVSANASSEMFAKPIDPQADGLAADNDTPLCQQILNIRRIQGEAMIHSGRVGNDPTRVAKALQARH